MTSLARTLGIYGREARAQILSTLRTPQFLVPSLVLPIMLFGFFGLGMSHGGAKAAQYIMAGYVIFAAIAPAMFGFGVGVATEREARLIELKRVSPMPIGAYLSARLAGAVSVVALAVCGVSGLAVFAGVELPAWRWASVIGLAIASAAPFALIGLNIGLRFSAQGATAVANLLFLILSALGGLWVPMSLMPHWLAQAAWVLPSFHLGELSRMLADLQPAKDVAAHVEIVLAISAVAAYGAWRSWRRQMA